MRDAHPWEVFRIGIFLFLQKDERGWWLSLSWSKYLQTVKTIKLYLALTDAGLPVSLYQQKELADMIAGKDNIGIVSEDVYPRYCGSIFPGENILQFMNLPYEYREETIAAAYWYPLEEVNPSEHD